MIGIGVRGHSGLRYRLAALVLVAVYVEAFGFWRSLVDSVGTGRADILPVALTVMVAIGLMVLALKLGAIGRKVRLQPVTIGIAIGIAALFLSDPDFPAKRIHVLEYGLLGLVVGRAFAADLEGRWLLAAAALATAVLGSHDELVQGLLTDRTFGLRDLGVDIVAGIAGIVIGDGLGMYWPATTEKTGGALAPAEWLGFGLLVVGWIALVIAMPGLVDAPMPLWPVVPVATGWLAWQIGRSGSAATGAHRAAGTIAILILATMVEPILAYALPLDFH